jgi:glycosyltransferase involved in cell wall biosynthesis
MADNRDRNHKRLAVMAHTTDTLDSATGSKATVCICAYNGATRIGEVLTALTYQTASIGRWETLVIDNASTDGTGAFAERFIKEKLAGCGRVVREEQPGLSFARARAAREARGEIICFLDDDNIPAPDFVKNAIQAFKEHPQAGSLGGKVIPQWESPPTPLAIAVADFALAICDRGDKAFKYARNLGPVGAGLCIRTEVLRRIYQNKKTAGSVVGRTGSGFGGGEDLAIAILTWRAGFECWYEPSIVIRHLLPACRMEKDYLLRLYNGIGRGQSAVRKLYDWKARTPLTWLIALKDLVRWLRGNWSGPSAQVCHTHPDIADDLHDLHQRMVWGRAMQAFRIL